MNSQLGLLLKSPLLATSVAFLSGFIFSLAYFLLFVRRTPSLEVIYSVPLYLWFSGGLLSAFAITCIYWLIPKLGVGPLMSFALGGQLLMAMIAGHYGWFQLPVTPVSIEKSIGAIFMIFGILLMNRQ